MLRLAGALLLAGGMAALGFAATGRLRRRVNTLTALAGALELMTRELSFRLTPMPELLEHLAGKAAPPVDLLFLHCREGLKDLGEVSLGQIWREGLRLAPLGLGQQDLEVLDGLGDVLGRYDGEGQLAALEQVRGELERILAGAREERDRLGRVYQAVGAAAGAALVILLL